MPNDVKAPRLAPRLMLCLATAIVISATAYLCAWYNFRCFWYFRPLEAVVTRSLLHELQDQITDYQRKNGHLPATLAELEEVKNRSLRIDRAGLPVDGWERPIHYEVQGNSYELYSLGRDGQPGGTGPDAVRRQDEPPN